MEMCSLGRSGLKVSRLCMGTMTFGDQADEAESRRMVDRCLDAGINFFDTANAYNAGRSEELVGRQLADRREEVIVATKVFNPMGPGPNDRGLSRKHILRAMDDSLRRLNMDYVDLYQLHQPDNTTPLDETMAAMDQLVREGKTRYVGISNFASWQVCQTLWLCEKHHWTPPVCVQPMYNLISRSIEQEFLPFCAEFGLGTMVYNPLAGGLLTGKHSREKGPAEGTRFGLKQMYRNRYWHDRQFDAVESLARIADKAGLSLIEFSLQWTLAQPGVSCLILGASSDAQLKQNLDACNGSFPVELVPDCDAVWEELRGPIPFYNR